MKKFLQRGPRGPRPVWFTALAALALAAAAPAQAQVQRTFVNLGFEQPDLGTGACVGFFAGPQQVTGWNTTHPSRAAGGCGITANPASGPIVELWGNSFNNTPARAGKQHAELNADQASRIYQNICLTNGEVIGWRLSHRGRNSPSVPDVMSFGINASGSTATAVSSEIAQIGTTNNGTDRVNTGGAAIPSSATQGTISIGSTVNGWRDYSGSFTYNGGTGVQQVGFAAVSSSGGISLGNFLDEIQITLRPYVEFDAGNYSVREGQSAGLPRLRVIGTVPSGGIVVPVRITGGTATQGSDYTVAGGSGTTVNVSIPAGTYDNATFDLPITVIDDAVIEDNETVTLQAQSDANAYTLTSTTTCSTNAPAQTSATLTILDNDVDVLTTKQVDNAAPAPGGTVRYTVTFRNNTARTTVGDTSMHDATVNLADAVPAGLTFTSWTCTPIGSATCPAASGSGAISATATLPAGNAAAGAGLTYVIDAKVGASQCAAVANTSTIQANAPVAEGTSAQAGFVTPAPGGSANNSASASIDPVCVSLSLSKSDGSATYTPGNPADYVLRACNANGPDAAAGASVSDALPRGVSLRAGWTCRGVSGGGSCPAGGGNAGDTNVAVTGLQLPVGACVEITVPVVFAATPGAY
ncbi:Calx-beta domain-containing protein [Lysobacter enzymogenes]|uniref:Calx-beta domain-containing protein n=1 Tax=Lysobacter enzymogenes TaxID=69 RepID=UPI00384FBA64